MTDKVKVRVPGSTSNLGSGFDTVSAALSIYLDISVEILPGKNKFWPDDFRLEPEENMILQAFNAACAYLGYSCPGLRFSVSNEIPLKRGLGSSAAAIIGGIKLAEGLSGKELSEEEIFSIAYPLEKHPDNLAASCLGGWALSLVSGGRMRAEPLESHLDIEYIVVIPEFTVSTREAREILPETYTLEDAVYNIQRASLLVHAVREGRPDLIRKATGDRLHQEYRSQLVPGMTDLLELRGLDNSMGQALLSVTVSGSGSAMLAMVDRGENSRLIGEWMCRPFSDRGITANYRILELDREGARLTRILHEPS